MPEGEKKLGVQVLKGGQNLPPLVGIGLTDPPKMGGGAQMPPHPGSNITASHLSGSWEMGTNLE